MSYMDLMLSKEPLSADSASASVLSEATPEDLQRIATDPEYPADPAMREEAQRILGQRSTPAPAEAPAVAPAAVEPPVGERAPAPSEPEPQRLLREKLAGKRRSYMDLMLDRAPEAAEPPAAAPSAAPAPPPAASPVVDRPMPGLMETEGFLTPEDHASPIPNELIAAGKAKIAQATGKGAKIEPVSDSSKAASIADIALASFANDPEARLRYYAKQRGLPESRYKVIDGEVAYLDDDGKWYREHPETLLRDPKTWAQGLANQAGPALTAVPPAVAGIATAPLLLTGPGMVGSIATTAGVGAASQFAREKIAEAVTGQQTDYGRVAQEAATAGLGQAVGAGLTAWGQKNAVSDIARLNKPAAEALERKAADKGIHLTPAESTNLPSLKARQKALGNLVQSADDMAAFYGERGEKIRAVVNEFLDGVSAQDSREVAGKSVRAAAEKAVDTAKAARAKVADPLYKAARESGAEVDVAPILSSIDEQLDVAKGPIKTALQNARSLLMREVDEAAPDGAMVKRSVPDTRITALHEAKLAIDDMIDGAAQSGLGNTAKAKLKGIQADLLDAMDAASPDYKAARAAFADASPAVNALEDGIVGIIKNLKDPNLKDAAQKLLSPTSSGPKAVAEARAALEKADPEAWQAIKRAWLQQNWESAGKQSMASGAEVVNQGPKFRNLIMGDLNRQRMLRAALTDEEYRGLSDLAEILEAAGRVKPMGSDTAWNQEMMRVARDEAAPLWGKAVEVVGTPLKWATMVKDWATERALTKNADKMVKIITEPDGLERLRELRQVTPGSAKFRAGVAHVLTRGGEWAVDAVLD